MQKALILGGKTGMLGQALMKTASEHGFEAFSLGREDYVEDTCAHGSTSGFISKSFLEKKIARINPDIIFNAIAYTAVDNAEDDVENAFLVNQQLPQYLAEIIHGSACHLVHYSTDFVFDGSKKSPYHENDSTKPLSIYGTSKLAGEEALMPLQNTTILRTAWLFGVGRKNFISTILKFAKERPSLQIVNDQIGSPTSTKDLAHMSFLVATKRKSGIYHAVNSGETSWFDFAKKAVELCKLPSILEPITTSQWPQKAIRPPYSVLSVDKFQNDFAYVVPHWSVALEEYLEEYIDAL